MVSILFNPFSLRMLHSPLQVVLLFFIKVSYSFSSLHTFSTNIFILDLTSYYSTIIVSENAIFNITVAFMPVFTNTYLQGSYFEVHSGGHVYVVGSWYNGIVLDSQSTLSLLNGSSFQRYVGT